MMKEISKLLLLNYKTGNIGPKGSEEPAARIPFAHDMAIWDMKWHPAGHLLATGSNDRQTKFWARRDLHGSRAVISSTSCLFV